jgi:SET domain-containing protein
MSQPPITASVAADSVDENGRLRRAPIQLRPSPLGGRGVFAAKPVREGALLEECPVLITNADYDELGDYVFVWGERADGRFALPLGYGACYNHAEDPNAHWYLDESRQLMIIWAARDIAADEEILVSYGPRWFPSRGLHPAATAAPLPHADVDPAATLR